MEKLAQKLTEKQYNALKSTNSNMLEMNKKHLCVHKNCELDIILILD